MLQQRTRKACGPRSTLNRIVVAALAASAIVPAAAVAQPADSVTGSTPVVTQDLRSPDATDSATNLAAGQDLRSPDAADSAGTTVRPGYPSQGPATVQVVEAPAVPDDGGIDTGVLIALIGGGVLLAGGGIALATRHRLHGVRQRATA
jgi:hypothetical protein